MMVTVEPNFNWLMNQAKGHFAFGGEHLMRDRILERSETHSSDDDEMHFNIECQISCSLHQQNRRPLMRVAFTLHQKRHLEQDSLDRDGIAIEQGGQRDASGAAGGDLLPNLAQQAQNALRRVVEAAEGPYQTHPVQDARQQASHFLRTSPPFAYPQQR